MLSRRLPPLSEPNAWSAALARRRAAGLPLLDLTESNPTRVGLAPLAEAAAALAAAGAPPYAPEPRGLPIAREAVASALASDGLRVSPEDILLTCGTSESYAHLFRLLGDPGDAFLAPVPSYPLFEPLARAEGVALRPYRLAFDGAWHLDRASFERAAPGARAAIVVQPNHPTGSSLDDDELAFVERVCEREGLALVSDEVFAAHPQPPRVTPVRSLLAGERRVPTFALGGLSKRCGLPQLKLGWIALGGPAAARRTARAGLEWLADLFLSVATPVQVASPALLALHPAFAARVRARLAGNLAAIDACVAARPAIARLPAEGGWSAVLRLPATRSDDDWATALAARGVAAHPGHFYDFEQGAHLVVSLIADPREVRDGLAVLAALAEG